MRLRGEPREGIPPYRARYRARARPRFSGTFSPGAFKIEDEHEHDNEHD